jgi:hypothetical protein
MMKEVYNMNVEAFTYVHDGSAKFALENAKHTCDKLKVVHHILLIGT